MSGFLCQDIVKMEAVSTLVIIRYSGYFLWVSNIDTKMKEKPDDISSNNNLPSVPCELNTFNMFNA